MPTKAQIEAAAKELAYRESYVWGSSGLDHDRLRESAEAILKAGRTGKMSTWDDKPNNYEHAVAIIDRLQSMVSEQAKDEGLWFVAQTAPEAYLQQELRRLHEAIEGTSAVECALEVLWEVECYVKGRQDNNER